MSPDTQRIADILAEAPLWLRTGLIAPDPARRTAAADGLAAMLARKLAEPAGADKDQMRLPW